MIGRRHSRDVAKMPTYVRCTAFETLLFPVSDLASIKEGWVRQVVSYLPWPLCVCTYLTCYVRLLRASSDCVVRANHRRAFIKLARGRDWRQWGSIRSYTAEPSHGKPVSPVEREVGGGWGPSLLPNLRSFVWAISCSGGSLLLSRFAWFPSGEATGRALPSPAAGRTPRPLARSRILRT